MAKKKVSKKPKIEEIEDEELEEDIEDIEEEIEDEITEEDNDESEEKEDEEDNVCSFQIEVGTFNKLLTYVKAKGYDASSSSTSDLISDCILRFKSSNSKSKKIDTLWIATTDEKKTLLGYFDTFISGFKGNKSVEIPIEISEMERWLGSFESSTIVKVIYENGVIALKDIKSDDISNFNMDTDVIFYTKMEDAITFDIIKLIRDGHESADALLELIYNKLGQCLYKVKGKDKLEVFFGKEFVKFIEIPAKVLKKIIDDGERIGNRVYPFDLQKDRLVIKIKSADESINDNITRKIQSSSYKCPKPFENCYASRLTNAVTNLKGDISLYIYEDSELILLSNGEKDITTCYIVSIF